MTTRSEHFYRRLLQLYPQEFRDEYAGPMAQCFHDMVQESIRMDGTMSMVKVWLRVLPDFTRSLVREHFESRWMRRDMMNGMPKAIGRYQVKVQIGDGSMSTVYRAYDPVRKKDMAIKLLKPQEPDPASLRWADYLQREVEVLNGLDHPAIPKAYGFFQSEAGAYLVMDLIKGQSLLDVLGQSQGFLPERDILRWGSQVCDVLTYLHTRKPQPLLFRDVKLSNLILDENWEFHLIDFDLTVPYSPGQTYEKIGTEGYAAPEQYAGCEEPRSDLYGLGAALHQLANRIDPREEVKHRPFTFAPPRSINPALSKAFAAVIQKALAYEPEDRFPSAAAMQAALEACL